MSVFSPPLLGDGHGNYRIHLVGNSGTGKSTLGTYLSSKLNLPYIALDGIFWKPNWETTSDEKFREQVGVLMAQNPQGWIIDGNYRVLGPLVVDNATDIVWLDPPLHFYLPRLLWRTLMRLLGLRPTCAEGCPETWAEVFSTKGIVWYCVRNHSSTRTAYTEWLSRMSVERGGKLRRLNESRGELAKWKEDLEADLRRGVLCKVDSAERFPSDPNLA